MQILYESLEEKRKTRRAQAMHKSYRRYPELPLDRDLASALFEEPSSAPSGYSDWRQYENISRDLTKRSNPGDREGHTVSDSAAQVEHLLSRASFGVSVAERADLSSLKIEEIVHALLDPVIPEPPGEWVNEPFDLNVYRRMSDEERLAFNRQNRRRLNEFRVWWLAQMISRPLNLLERMTLFWHGLFTSDLTATVLAQFAYKQNSTWRTHALGNFRSFLKAMYKDPAMLFYLDGVENEAAAPNENFARELLELFTIGVGHYTETDIKNAARALTGWQVDFYGLTSFLHPNLHDHGIKSFLGQSGDFDGEDIVDIILEQPETATYICRRLYETFVGRVVDDAFVDRLADLFRTTGYEISPVLEMLFTSEHFYSQQVVGSLIKSPVLVTVSNVRMLAIRRTNVYTLLEYQAILDQEIYNPPNVAGWPGQRHWISPSTYVLRNTISEIFVSPEFASGVDGERPPVDFSPLDFARSFGISDARELAAAMIRHLLRLSVPEETLDFLVEVLVGSADPKDWSLDYPGADRLVTQFLVQLVRLPEFHLT